MGSRIGNIWRTIFTFSSNARTLRSVHVPSSTKRWNASRNCWSLRSVYIYNIGIGKPHQLSHLAPFSRTELTSSSASSWWSWASSTAPIVLPMAQSTRQVIYTFPAVLSFLSPNLFSHSSFDSADSVVHAHSASRSAAAVAFAASHPFGRSVSPEESVFRASSASFSILNKNVFGLQFSASQSDRGVQRCCWWRLAAFCCSVQFDDKRCWHFVLQLQPDDEALRLILFNEIFWPKKQKENWESFRYFHLKNIIWNI